MVRSVEADGLHWGACESTSACHSENYDRTISLPICAAKFVPVAYGIKKLQITCVIEDDKIGTDFLEEEITAFEDYVRVDSSLIPRPSPSPVLVCL